MVVPKETAPEQVRLGQKDELIGRLLKLNRNFLVSSQQLRAEVHIPDTTAFSYEVPFSRIGTFKGSILMHEDCV